MVLHLLSDQPSSARYHVQKLLVFDSRVFEVPQNKSIVSEPKAASICSPPLKYSILNHVKVYSSNTISMVELMINFPTQQPLGSKKPALVAYVQCFDLAVALTLALWQHPEAHAE